MAFAFHPILKVLAPIATAVIPSFTSKPAESAKTDPVVIRQIEELQAATTKNAEALHTLAENLQQTIQSLDVAAADAKSKWLPIEQCFLLLLASLGLRLY